MTLKLCDLDWYKPGPSSLAAAGFHAASLYVSQDDSGKNMNAAYVHSLAAVGLWTVTNFEYAADQMLSGYAQGVIDAKLGRSIAQECGMPAGRPIYYSADFNATPAQMTSAVIPYLQGARSVTGPGTVGFYGGYTQVLAVLAHWAQTYPGERIYIWQSPAWSDGLWSAQADVRQQVAQETVAGVLVDIDYAFTADFGQWQPGVVPAVPVPAPADHPATMEDDVSTTSNSAGRAGLSWAAGSRHVVQVTYDPRDGDPKLRVVLALTTGPLVASDAWQLSGGSGVFQIPAANIAACRGVILEGAPAPTFDVIAV